jgi:hypothetical protein
MLAKVLATSREDSVRNGSEALRHAEQACKLTANNHPAVLQTLAAAQAEAGDFAKAVETAGKAIDLARAANDPALVEKLESQRQGYVQGRPFRETAY